MTPKILLTAQVVITFCMAVTMSSLMSLMIVGYSDEWLASISRQVAVAWPVAFCFTQVYGRLGFFIAQKVWGKPQH